MERRDFLAFLALTGCGGEMEYQIQPSPRLRTSQKVFQTGVSDSWTPALTFATPGNVSVTYTTQAGVYVRFGDLVVAFFDIITATFTHTTANSFLLVTGLPDVVINTPNSVSYGGGNTNWQGITKANYTDITPHPAEGQTYCTLVASGSGQSRSSVQALDVPSGGSVSLHGFAIYKTSDTT